MFRRLLPLLTLFIAIARGQSDHAADTSRTYVADPVTVTATRVEVSRSNVSPSVSVISQETLAAESQRSIFSVISQQVPGVFVQERGVLGFGVNSPAGQVTIRGIGGNSAAQVLVLVDGRPQFMGLFGHPLGDTYLATNAERVEVLRGPASLMYGTNAMGGVINIITQSSEPAGTYGDATTAYGSFNSDLENVRVGYRSDVWDLAASGSHQHTGGHRPHSDFNVSSGYVRAGAQLSAVWNVIADAGLTAFTTSDPGPASAPLSSAWVDIRRGYVGLSLEDHLPETSGALRFIHNFGNHKIFDGFRSTDALTSLSLYQSFRVTPENTFTIGADYKRYGGDVTAGPVFVNQGQFDVTEYAGYVHTRQQVSDALVIDGGFRWEHHNLYGSQVVPQIGAALRIADETIIRASAAKGYRSPIIGELFLFPPSVRTLKPEIAWNYEVGVMRTIGSTASVEAAAFVIDGRDLIRQPGGPFSPFSNSGSFTHRGVEFAGTLLPAESVQLNMNYSYLDAGADAGIIPKHKAFAGMTYGWNALTVIVNVQYVHATLYTADLSASRTSDYTIVGGKVSYRAFSRGSVFLGVENLLDRSYQTIYDYPMPGRIVSGGVQVIL